MGNEGSKEKVSNYSVGFTENELNSLRHEFSKASDGKPNLSLNELQKITSALPIRLQKTIIKLYSIPNNSNSQSNNITFPVFVSKIGSILKNGSNGYQYFTNLYGQTNNIHEAEALIQDIALGGFTHYSELKSFELKSDTSTKITNISDRLLHYLYKTCLSPHEADDNSSLSLQLENFSDYLSKSQELWNLWENLWENVFPMISRDINITSTLRQKCYRRPDNIQSSQLLSVEDVWFLDVHLSPEYRPSSWKLIFSSAQHGNNWTLFQSNVLERGATLLIIREKGAEGRVFGGFASCEWCIKPKFYGNSDSFLFQLQPYLQLFKSSGINQNYQYFNHGAQTFPNGLGFGGQIDYFGLWLDSSFIRGNSKAAPHSTTFGNTQLSTNETFEIDHVEVWLVKEKEVDDRLIQTNTGSKSILDTHPDAQAILELSGRRMYSSEVREPNVID